MEFGTPTPSDINPLPGPSTLEFKFGEPSGIPFS